MVISLQINKIISEKSENLKKIIISQNPARIITENCFFKKAVFSWFFLNCSGENSI